MTTPRFMKDRSWRAGWPEDIQETVEKDSLPDVPWKGQIARYRRIFQAMAGVDGANSSIPEIEDLVRKMEKWSERHSVYFSWPPTMSGWSRAVWATLSEPHGKDDMAWLMAGYGPSLRLALSERPSPSSWAISFQAAIAPSIVKEQIKEISPAPSAEKVVSEPIKDKKLRTDDTTAKPTPTKTAYEEPAEVLETRRWLIGVLAKIQEQRAAKKSDGTLVEMFDGEIKARIEKREHVGQKREAGWIEYELIPALANLSPGQLELFHDLWPSTHSKSFIDPQKTLSGRRFWAVLDGAPKASRPIFLNKILPQIIDSSEWPSTTRYLLAKEMLSWTKARPEAFEERLALWRSWGGRFDDAAAPVVSESNRFNQQASAPETVDAWIRGNGVEAWNAVLDTLQKPRSTPGMG